MHAALVSGFLAPVAKARLASLRMIGGSVHYSIVLEGRSGPGRQRPNCRHSSRFGALFTGLARRVLKTPSTIPLAPFLAGRGKNSRQRGFALCTPLFQHPANLMDVPFSPRAQVFGAGLERRHFS